MSIAESAITPELPPVSMLPPVPLRRPGEHSETGRQRRSRNCGAEHQSCVLEGGGRQRAGFRGYRGQKRGFATRTPGSSRLSRRPIAAC